MFGDFYIFIQVCVEIYPREGIETRDVKTIKSSFFPNLNDKFNPKELYKKGKMC